MLTTIELGQAVLLPAVVALALGLFVRWRRWAWAVPFAILGGFFAGWAAFRGLPTLNPRDGTDRLIGLSAGTSWLAVALWEARCMHRSRRWTTFFLALGVCMVGWTFGGIAWPLQRAGAVPFAPLALASLAIALAAALIAAVAYAAAPRIGLAAILCVMAIVIGACGVVVFSSHLRVVGVYGLSAAAATGGAAVAAALGAHSNSSEFAEGIVLYPVAIAAGVLSGGHYYPEPGVGWGYVAALFALPLLMFVGAVTPTKRGWVRVAVTILVVGAVAAAIAAPIAIKAKKAAEEDPYAAYR